jgi:hypothetical protein
MSYYPTLPPMTFEELQESDPDAHEVLNHILFEAAKNVYACSPEIGLEAIFEDTISLYNKGFINLLYDDEEEEVKLGVFNPATGRYYLQEQGIDG